MDGRNFGASSIHLGNGRMTQNAYWRSWNYEGGHQIHHNPRVSWGRKRLRAERKQIQPRTGNSHEILLIAGAGSDFCPLHTEATALGYYGCSPGPRLGLGPQCSLSQSVHWYAWILQSLKMRPSFWYLTPIPQCVQMMAQGMQELILFLWEGLELEMFCPFCFTIWLSCTCTTPLFEIMSAIWLCRCRAEGKFVSRWITPWILTVYI